MNSSSVATNARPVKGQALFSNTELQRKFVEHYARCGNAAEAAYEAGYHYGTGKDCSTFNTAAKRLLASPKIRDAVEKELRRLLSEAA